MCSNACRLFRAERSWVTTWWKAGVGFQEKQFKKAPHKALRHKVLLSCTMLGFHFRVEWGSSSFSPHKCIAKTRRRPVIDIYEPLYSTTSHRCQIKWMLDTKNVYSGRNAHPFFLEQWMAYQCGFLMQNRFVNNGKSAGLLSIPIHAGYISGLCRQLCNVQKRRLARSSSLIINQHYTFLSVFSTSKNFTFILCTSRLINFIPAKSSVWSGHVPLTIFHSLF